MTLTVHSAECPALPDGRRRHLFQKVDGVFTCSNCSAKRDNHGREMESGGPTKSRTAAQRGCQAQVTMRHYPHESVPERKRSAK